MGATDRPRPWSRKEIRPLSRNVNPKIVSEKPGHSTIAITLDTYSHVLPNMQQSAVRAFEEVLE